MSWLSRVNKRIRQALRKEDCPEDDVTIFNAGGKPVLTISPDRVIFVKAAENYAVFNFIGKDGKVEDACVRCTLSHAEEAFSPHLQRCHRSYLYNPDHLIHFYDIPGESRLELYAPDRKVIPVTVTHRNRILKVIQILTEREQTMDENG